MSLQFLIAMNCVFYVFVGGKSIRGWPFSVLVNTILKFFKLLAYPIDTSKLARVHKVILCT